MRPGGVTFGVIGSSLFWKCVKLLAEQLWQIWRRYAPPFFSLSAKNLRGGGGADKTTICRAPGRARVNIGHVIL